MGTKNLKIVGIRGGHGQEPFTKGLNKYTKKLTSLINNSDSGGSRGLMVRDYRSVLSGDFTQAWADHCINPEHTKLIRKRYQNGSLDPHRTGNIMIQSLVDISKDERSKSPEIDAISKMKSICPIKGDVWPMTLQMYNLITKDSDTGDINNQEHLLDERINKGAICDAWLEPTPKSTDILKQAKDALTQADIILIGAGSVWGSEVAALLVGGVSEAIAGSQALIFYVMNIATVPGQTNGWSFDDHAKNIERFLQHPLDAIIYFTTNIRSIADKVKTSYEHANQQIVNPPEIESKYYPKTYSYNLVTVEKEDNKMVFRHNPEASANAIFETRDKILKQRSQQSKLFVF